VEDVLVTLHVLAAIVLLGPITVAASLFPRYAREALSSGKDTDRGAAAVLHRITRAYALPCVAVPVLGLWLAGSDEKMGEGWVIASTVLTALAAAVLVALVLPAQGRVVDVLRDGGDTAVATATSTRLAMTTGVFGLLWVVVLVLMVVRPGS